MRYWRKLKYYYLTHDGIEMLLFTAVFSTFGWMAYHVIIGVIRRFGS